MSIGTVARPGQRRSRARPTSTQVDAEPVRCLDPDASAAMVAEIDEARRAGDTLGGVVEVLAYGLPPGLGQLRRSGTAASTRGWPPP